MALNADLLYRLTEKKRYSDELSNLYSAFDQKRAGRISECCSEMYVNDNGDFYRTWFCADKFCPVCSFRRTKIMEARMFGTVEELIKKGFQFIFVTYTVPNCSAEDLRKVCLKMSKASSDLQAKYRRSLRGSFKGLEVTYNEAFNTYHPHYHVLYVVDKDYFVTDKYICQSRLADIWTGLNGLTGKIFDSEGNITPCVVHVKKVRPDSITSDKEYIGLVKAVLETTKYPFKLDDLFSIEDYETKLQVLQTLHKSLRHLRMYSFSGILKQVEKEINIDFEENFRFIQLPVGRMADSSLIFHNYYWNSLSRYYIYRKSCVFDELAKSVPRTHHPPY